MRFDKKTHKVDIKTLNKEEAEDFIWFLEKERWRHLAHIDEIKDILPYLNATLKRLHQSAILRHQEDIKDIDRILKQVGARFKI